MALYVLLEGFNGFARLCVRRKLKWFGLIRTVRGCGVGGLNTHNKDLIRPI